MPAKKKRRSEVEQALAQARHDLDSARKNLDVGAFEVCAFLCQQSIEKAFKALYMHQRRRRPEATHSLTELGKSISAPSSMATWIGELTSDYTRARYPEAANGIPHEVYTKEMAASRVAAAEEIWKWLDRQF